MAVKRGGERLLRRTVACARPPRHRPHARTHMQLTQRPTRIKTDPEKRRLGKRVRPSCDARGARPLLPSFALSAPPPLFRCLGLSPPVCFPTHARARARPPPLAARARLHRTQEGGRLSVSDPDKTDSEKRRLGKPSCNARKRACACARPHRHRSVTCAALIYIYINKPRRRPRVPTGAGP